MCLGIPGQLVEFMDEHEHLAKIDVAGVRRTINIGLLEDEGLVLGDWVLIHVGFAMSKIDEAEAQMAMEGLQLMGQAYEDEVAALVASRVAEDLGTGDGVVDLAERAGARAGPWAGPGRERP
jgi:hydrogenase expression/formation protein HypC